MAFLKPVLGSGAEPTPASAHAAVPYSIGARAVVRALSDLRRGLPCVVVSAHVRLAVAAVETLDSDGFGLLKMLVGAPPQVMLLSSRRVGALMGSTALEGDVSAIVLEPSLCEPARLRSLADPSVAEAAHPVRIAVTEPPSGSDAALLLAKRARLLPAMVAGLLPESADAGAFVIVSAAELEADAPTSMPMMVRVAEAAVPLADSPDSRIVAFRDGADGVEHLAVLVGRPEGAERPLVRIHSECFTGDLLGSLRCDCGPQLRGAIRRMSDEGAGVLLYLAQEGRGIGLVNKLRAYALQDRGLDTVDANRALGWDADERDYGVAAAMLRLLGMRQVRLLTNNPRKLAALALGGIEATRVSHLFASNGINDGYLATKVARFGHLPE